MLQRLRQQYLYHFSAGGVEKIWVGSRLYVSVLLGENDLLL